MKTETTLTEHVPTGAGDATQVLDVMVEHLKAAAYRVTESRIEFNRRNGGYDVWAKGVK